jgi:signal transduction histidine kinase
VAQASAPAPGPRRRLGLFSALRWRLTFLYLGLLAGLLVVLGGVQYFALRQALIEADAEVLRNDYKAVYDAFIRPRQLSATPTPKGSRPPVTPTPAPAAGPPPTVTRLQPNSAPAGGGTTVSIVGTGFKQGATVRFGPNLAQDVTCPSPTECRAKSPPGNGLVDVLVTVDGQTSAHSTGARFTYLQQRESLVSQAFANELASRRISALVLGLGAQRIAQAPACGPGDSACDTEIPTLPLREYERAQQGKARPYYLVPSESRAGHAYVVILVPIRQSPDPRALIQGVAELAISTDDLDAVLARDRFLYLLGSLGILVLALILSPLITARALRPLERMGRTAAALAAGDYKQRVNLPQRADEVGKLARAFDEMADRIDQAFQVRRHSEDRMRQFVADASHELRTPLTSIGGYLDVLLRQERPDPETVKSALAAMQRQSTRMTRLVNDLLQLTRIEGGRALRREPLALDTVVDQTLDDMELAVPVERKLEPVRVLGDADALKQVVTNLAQNAVKYAPGAKQEWACYAANGTATLRLRDHGPGIPVSDLPHVFERFYRGEKMRARDQGGSGLGLAIVKSIVEAQGGHVEAESAPGEGATFTITLPIQLPGRPETL